MIPCDPAFTPPALIVPVHLSGTVFTRPRLRYPALVDTGADVTAIPAEAAKRLKLYPVDELKLEGIEATAKPVFVYTVRLTLANRTYPRLEVVLTDYNFIVLGRDVLSDYYLLLNGPEETFDLRSSPFVLTD